MAEPTYRASAIDLAETSELMVPLLAKSLADSRNLDRKVRWFYREGPHGPGEAFVVRASGAPIGCAGIGVRTLCVRGTHVRAALFADLAVEQGHRTALPALTLLRTIERHVVDRFDLGYGFPNSKALPVYQRAGYRVLGEMPRYVRLLRTGALWRSHLPAPLAGPVAAVVDRALAALGAAHAWRVRHRVLRWADDIPAEVNALWCEAMAAHPIACVRDRELLRWRFVRGPEGPYRVVELRERSNSELRAYAVVRWRADDGVAEIADLFGPTTTDLDDLLALLVPALAARGASAVSIRFLGASRIPALLARHGFVRRGPGRAIVVRPGSLDALDPEAWYLTDLDEDV